MCQEIEVTFQYIWTCSPLGQRMLTDLSGNSFNDSLKLGYGNTLKVGLGGAFPHSNPTVVFHDPTNPIKLDLLHRIPVHNSNNRLCSQSICSRRFLRSDLNEDVDLMRFYFLWSMRFSYFLLPNKHTR